MIVKITSKRQVTFPARVLDALGVGPGDQLELEEGAGGFVLRPRRIDYSRLGTLRDKIPPGHPPLTSGSSGNKAMIRRYGIDTSVLVRLLTGDPEKDFQYCVSRLRALIDEQGGEIFASNQVVGEAYVAVQHHYGVSKAAARASLLDVLRSGLVSPVNGRSVIEALETSSGAGLLDRLIAEDYSRAGMEVLTLDRKMAVLSDVRRL